MDGHSADSPDAHVYALDEEDNEDAPVAPPKKTARGRAKAAGITRQTAAAAKKTSAATQKAPAPRATRGKKKVVAVEESDKDDEDDDVIMIDEVDNEGSDESDGEDLFVGQKKRATSKTTSRASRAKSPVKKTTASTTRTRKPPATKQSTLNFSQNSTQRAPTQRAAASRASKAIEEASCVR